jgi:hypothetical protein
MRTAPEIVAGRRAALAAAAAIAIGACGGVPMRTMAKLAISGPDEFLGADPRDVRVALDVDTRVKPQAGRVPVLDVALVPASGATRSWSIPLEPDPASAGGQGLRAPRDGRHWLVWRLPEPGVRDFREMQAALKAMQANDESGSLAITVRQDWIGDGWPALKQDRIETWVRTRSADGYFELWSGRVGDAARERT